MLRYKSVFCLPFYLRNRWQQLGNYIQKHKIPAFVTDIEAWKPSTELSDRDFVPRRRVLDAPGVTCRRAPLARHRRVPGTRQTLLPWVPLSPPSPASPPHAPSSRVEGP